MVAINNWSFLFSEVPLVEGPGGLEILCWAGIKSSIIHRIAEVMRKVKTNSRIRDSECKRKNLEGCDRLRVLRIATLCYLARNTTCSSSLRVRSTNATIDSAVTLASTSTMVVLVVVIVVVLKL